jgi:hypothetical protein
VGASVGPVGACVGVPVGSVQVNEEQGQNLLPLDDVVASQTPRLSEPA